MFGHFTTLYMKGLTAETVDYFRKKKSIIYAWQVSKYASALRSIKTHSKQLKCPLKNVLSETLKLRVSMEYFLSLVKFKEIIMTSSYVSCFFFKLNTRTHTHTNTQKTGTLQTNTNNK